MLKGDLTIDPFTGLPNFFGFLEMAAQDIFGKSGMVVAIDIAGLMSVNTIYGRKAGDDCVRALAGALRMEIMQKTSDSSAYGFRMGGDEFALVMPACSPDAANTAKKQIESRFAGFAVQNDMKCTGLHFAIVDYDEPVSNKAGFIQKVHLALGRFHAGGSPSDLPVWAERLIGSMSNHISETLSLLREARTLALTDEISGLPNHRAATIYIDEMVTQYRNDDTPFSLLLADGDRLKEYNNLSYEHGNQVIRNLGQLLTKAVRYGDKVARWLSGDEFVILLPGTDSTVAFQVAERLRAAVENGAQTWVYPTTISIGVATCPTDGVSLAELVTKMEAANLVAKKAGKNQVA